MDKPFNITAALFVVGAFVSLVAWSVNGLVTEISQRKIVQYQTSVEAKDGYQLFVARIENLSGRLAVEGAQFRILPQLGKSLLPGDDGAIGSIGFPGVVDVQASVSPSTPNGVAEFQLPILPPGAQIELAVRFPSGDPLPQFNAVYTKANTDKTMRLVSACTLEARLVRNQVAIYLSLLFLALVFILIWAVMVFFAPGGTSDNGDKRFGDTSRAPRNKRRLG